MDIQQIKQRFGIVGNNDQLNQAINTAVQIAPIQLSVLIVGESGTGKEVFPQIIHSYSQRKHQSYVAVNCGAIPEGTIDSELFGHEKGAFTGAISDRKGYFEEADGGTIFLDEIGELPISTQAKLLRVLEKGEFMKVGSSKVQKTNVRIVGATNVNLEKAIADGRFREDLFYRLNGIMIHIPPLRNRPDDIPTLFRKFASDFATANRMPVVRLNDEAVQLLSAFRWPGNVRQLKNVAEQISVLAQDRTVGAQELKQFLPNSDPAAALPSISHVGNAEDQSFNTEREILYKVLFDMKRDMTDLKKLVLELMHNNADAEDMGTAQLIKRLYHPTADSADIMQPASHNADNDEYNVKPTILNVKTHDTKVTTGSNPDDEYMPQNGTIVEEIHDEELSLVKAEKDLIERALTKHNGRRRAAAQELGISERTLYRKLVEYGIEDFLKK